MVFCWPSRKEPADFDLQFSLALLVTVLVSYHAYAHDLSLLFLPLLLVANHLKTTLASTAQRKLAMMGPMFLLFLSPLYVLLWFYYGHLNLLGLALLWWAWELWREIRQQNPTLPSKELRGAS
jgi:hypothetical protein